MFTQAVGPRFINPAVLKPRNLPQTKYGSTPQPWTTADTLMSEFAGNAYIPSQGGVALDVIDWLAMAHEQFGSQPDGFTEAQLMGLFCNDASKKRGKLFSSLKS